jgi:hypothetical protein
MKTEEHKEYHAAHIVYEQAMLHIHRLTADMKDKSLASVTHYHMMMSLRKSVEDAIKKEKQNIEDAYDWGLAYGLDWGADDNDEPDYKTGEEYYQLTYGTKCN